jgi:hypothetical protein
MQYMKDAIVNLGIKLAHGHAGCSIITARRTTRPAARTIGEVVGKTIQAVGNKLSVLAATYIYPQFRSLPLDVVFSFEAEVESYAVKKGNEAIDFQNVTGIALGNSKVTARRFAGRRSWGRSRRSKKGGATMYYQRGDSGSDSRRQVCP